MSVNVEPGTRCMKKMTTRLAFAGAAVMASSAITVSAAAGPASAPSAASSTSASSIHWGKCSDPYLSSSDAQCAMVSVPLDYADPSGGHIHLAVSRIKHTSSASHYQGVMFVNPGGPGASGVTFATVGANVPRGVGGDYDWIGFDPRGVGSSRPALHCVDNYFHYDRPDYRPRSASLVHTWLRRSKRYADACARKYPRLIHHMTTADVARDMNQIRLGLGVQKISYYGYSYGTYLGQVFGTLFPTHVRRMVLDSTVNPHRVWYKANLDQDRAFQRNAKIWFRWLAKYHSRYHLGSTERAVEKLWYAQVDKLAKNPAGGKLGPDEWADAFLEAGYYRDTWLTLADDFAGFVHKHQWRPILFLYASYYGPHDDNGFAVYNAVQCTDAPAPSSWRTWKSDAQRVAAHSPFYTWGNLWYNAPCLYWHAPAGKPVTIVGAGVPSMLLVDETLDAATPFSGSLVARRLFPHSSLIAEPGGTTHADTLFGDKCVDSAIASYLASGKRPPRQRWDGPDKLCRPLPDPKP